MRPVPIYNEFDEAYRADNCAPLIEAVERKEARLQALVHGHYPGRRFPSQALPGVKTVGYWDAPRDQQWGLDWHRNEGIELTFLETGSLAFSVDNREFDLEPDALTITRPWQRHRVGRPSVTAGRLHWLIIDVSVRRPNQKWTWPSWLLLTERDRDELTDYLRHNEQPVWRATADMRRCFQAIAHAVESDRNDSHLSRLTVRLNDLFLLLLDMLRDKPVRIDQTLSSSRRTVRLYLADLAENPEHLSADLSVRNMAAACGLGPTQFIHHVKALTNMSPVHYIGNCRLDLGARILVDEPDAGITDAALRCGFASGQYFATAFVKRFGMSPREYRTAQVREASR